MSIFKSITDVLTAKSHKNQNWWNDGDVGIEKISMKDVGALSAQKEHSTEWGWPVKIPVITSEYGWRKILGKKRWHNGVDYSGRSNKETIAPCDMIVKKILQPDKEYPVKFAWSNERNSFVRIKDIPKGRAWTPYIQAVCAFDERIKFVFRHTKSMVEVGQYIPAGEEFCIIGNYGYCLGAHLHFEISYKGKEQNPVKFLNKKMGRTA